MHRSEDGRGSDAILGAGALGLTLALRLAQQGRSVDVYEREPLPGGLAAGFEVAPGIWLDRFYHHIFRSDRHAVRLIEELGLGSALTWHRPVTATLRDGTMHQLDSPMSLLRLDPLPLVDRLRMGAWLAFLRALPGPGILEGQRAARWIRRTMGRRAYDVVWGPLLEGKFGAAAEEIALPWFWARVHDRTPDLGYVDGGFQRLYDALAERIRSLGGRIHFGTAVESVEQDRGGFSVQASGGSQRFARVISTLPTRLTCRLVRALPEAYRQRHDWGRAYGAHCLILALDRQLTDDVYWLNVNDPGFPFMALVEHTNMRSPDEYGGRHLVYLGNYRPMDDPLLASPVEAVLEGFVPALARINPEFDRSWITDAWSFAAPFAQPIVTTDYRHHIPPLETPVPGLFVANMFQVYPHDRGQNYSIQLAERAASALARG
ncbi:MAG: NAD(P)/FAD-dependent oxidoreductase [Candidatus Limnocylindria bacterium]